ncbi:unnamed protein product [Zymoseptoria tritici ST99CH_1A5]|uniref:Protein kinase domain-containing protein n=1 Tax=Zymoseptoria tritici ST99CH_1A5 TaxID=1276529 RepID=A0A1Y6M0F6_ZYMTR|nr:unnamed protein product [Zymoseptoria tritici ST99CH_1A5]
MLRSLNHPNISKLQDFVDPAPYFSNSAIRESYFVVVPAAKDCLDRAVRDLRSLLPPEVDSDKFRPFFAAQFLGQTADACAYLHEQGIMHRDLKPANVALQPVNPSISPQSQHSILGAPGSAQFQVYIGQAKRAASSENHMVGTITYLAPETMLLKDRPRPTSRAAAVPPYTSKVDIWALGLCCWQVLVGRTLTDNDQAMQVAREVVEEFGQNPSNRLWGVVAEMLVQDCRTRISAREILQRMDLDDQP